MKQRSKRYRSVAGDRDRKATYSIAEAVAQVKKGATAKFVESVDLSIHLHIDTKQSDQLVRGSFALPNGTGKATRVIAFAEGPDAEAARAAGAVEVGSDDLVDKIQKGWFDFDVAIAHPGMMRFVGKIGKALGPKGLMPSPKSGTVTENVGQAVKEFAGGRIEFRNDPHGIVSVRVGNVKFDDNQLGENVEAFLHHITSMRPAAVKGLFVLSATLSSTMGPGYRLTV